MDQQPHNFRSVGRFYLLKATPAHYEKANRPEVANKIRDIITAQVEIRGESKPFTIKALGLTWRYEPSADAHE